MNLKDIPGFEKLYAATEDGRIWSYYSNKFLKPNVGRNGYLKVCLIKDHQRCDYSVHRLIALTYLENPNNLPVVNHKDENKQNNNVNNLEWCTYTYNSNYGSMPERMSQNMKNFLENNPDFNHGASNHRSIPIKCIETGEEFSTFTEAAKWSGLANTACFTDYFKGKQGSAGKHPQTNQKLHWQKFEDGDWKNAIPYQPIERKSKYFMKKVKCIETGEIFDSITAAQKHYNVSHVGECCLGTRKTTGGKHWEFI